MPSIICADDDPEMRVLYQRILEKRDYQVRYRDSGEAVLQAFQEAPADLVILDMHMPGLSGLGTTEALRKDRRSFQVPILIVSANDNEETIVKGLSTGADEYIVKPFKASELLAKISVALNKRGAAANDHPAMAPGGHFAGRYEIVSKLGSGGFSTVYLSRDTGATPPRECALKLYDLPPSRRDDRQFLSSFLREAYELSRLDHPNIVKLYDFGHINGQYYLSMEFVRGKTLELWLREVGALPAGTVASIGYHVSLALKYMDSNRIIHRDLKPANIMITDDGGVKLLDFGLAKKRDEGTISLRDEFRGTPQFVAPEYILGEADLDIRCDLYSLGATLYNAATNVRPFTGNSTIDILNNHFREVPPPAHLVNSAIPRELSIMIAKMMQRDRNLRPTLDEVMEFLWRQQS